MDLTSPAGAGERRDVHTLQQWFSISLTPAASEAAAAGPSPGSQSRLRRAPALVGAWQGRGLTALAVAGSLAPALIILRNLNELGWVSLRVAWPDELGPG